MDDLNISIYRQDTFNISREKTTNEHKNSSYNSFTNEKAWVLVGNDSRNVSGFLSQLLLESSIIPRGGRRLRWGFTSAKSCFKISFIELLPVNVK